MHINELINKHLQSIDWLDVIEQVSFLESKLLIDNYIKDGIININHQFESKKSENYIFQMWYQDEERPKIVSKCLNSVRENFKDKEIILITKKNIHNYVNLPGYIYDHLDKHMRICHFADIVRSQLLSTYGGIWIDATVFITRNPDELLVNDFFAFNHIPTILNGNNYRWIETWFLYSNKSSELFDVTYKFLIEYWKRNDHIMHYFMFNHFLIILNKILNFHLLTEQSLNYAIDPHLMLLNWNRTFSYELYNKICLKSPIHKLTYSLEFPYGIIDNNNSLQQFLLKD
jgi:hypothetical protein